MELLSIEKASKQLNVPGRMLRRLVQEQRVPFIQVGNRAYLIADILEEALRKDAYKVVKTNESDESND